MADNDLTATGGSTTQTGMEAGENTPVQSGERTFSQVELDRIVQTRIAQERSRSEAPLAAKEQELAQRELLLTARERFAQEGLPGDLLPIVNVHDADSLDTIVGLLKTHLSTPQRQQAANTTPLPLFTRPVPPGQAAPVADPIRCAMGLNGKDV